MKKVAYIVVVGIVLVVIAAASWVVDAVRRPFLREVERRRRIEGMLARHGRRPDLLRLGPPEHVLRACEAPAPEAARRQFALWG